MNMRNRLWPISGLLSATLLLSGCYNEPEVNHTSHNDGRIKLAILQPPRSGLTPLSDDAFKLSRWSTAETLVVLDKLGEAQPALATQWQQIDDKSWRFELRPNVHFHDNSAFNAATVVNALTVASTAAP
ncbi:ABC transporter substrate-binding protein, partial [Pectobacterium brasiliense]|uniref:ABC transporter substrate-binding protein n=1 Tax=Pectobacterium brasiliense TaxID=180957 RepID=UPI001F07D3C8